MRIFWASLAAALVALALAASAPAARPGFAVKGWVVPATTTHVVTFAGKPLTLWQLPLNVGYVWPQPHVGLTTQVPLTLAQLPLLTTYLWAQPKTAPQHVLHGQPWSL